MIVVITIIILFAVSTIFLLLPYSLVLQAAEEGGEFLVADGRKSLAED